MDVQDIIGVMRLEKSRRFWRVAAVLAAMLLVLALWQRWGDRAEAMAEGDYFARVRIEGMIVDDPEAIAVLDDLADDASAKGVVVVIDSPGGTMVGGLNLYDALRRVAAKKPLVSVMGTTAASAGYLIALAGDHIIASPGTLTGSIGVLLPLMDMRGLGDKIGIRSDSVVSGNLKEVTSPLVARDARARAYLQDLVNAMDGVFMGYVKERRNPRPDVLALIADGRALAGVQALKLGLVDALGGEAEARLWLARKAGADVPLEDVELREEEGWLTRALEGRFDGAGLAALLLGGRAPEGILAVAR